MQQEKVALAAELAKCKVRRNTNQQNTANGATRGA
jgi:hypothetical protein